MATAYVVALVALTLTSIALAGSLYHRVTQPPPEVMLVKDNNNPRLDVFEHNDRGRHIYEEMGYEKFAQSEFMGEPLQIYQKQL